MNPTQNTKLVTLDERALDDAVFRCCEEAAVCLATLPLRMRAQFAIEASAKIMAAVTQLAIRPNVPVRGRPPGKRVVVPKKLTPAADITPTVLRAPVPADARPETNPLPDVPIPAFGR